VNSLFLVIIFIVLLDFIVDRILDYLNLKSFSPVLPKEAEGIYDAEKYRKSMDYYKANDRFSMITSSFSLLLLLAMLFLNGFAFLDSYVRSITTNPIWMSLFFFGVIGLASDLLSIPFSLYKIFVIEEKFGFNKMTLKTFFLDKLK